MYRHWSASPSHEPPDRVLHEPERIAVLVVASVAAHPAGPVQFSVVAVAREVEVVAHQVRRRERNPGPRKQHELDEPRRPPVAVPVRMNPRNVQMGQRRLQDALGHAPATGVLEDPTWGANRRVGRVGRSSGVPPLGRPLLGHAPFGRPRPGTRHVVLVQPPAKSVQQVVAVLSRRGPIPADPDLEGGHLSRNDSFPQHLFQPAEHGPVGVGDPLSCKPRRGSGHNPVPNVPAGVQDVDHFLSQVALRRRQVEGTVQCLAHLFLGQRVVLDGGRRPGALDEVRRVEPPGGTRRQDGARNLLAECHGLPQQRPEPGRRPVEVDREADPGVAGLVGAWGHGRKRRFRMVRMSVRLSRFASLDVQRGARTPTAEITRHLPTRGLTRRFLSQTVRPLDADFDATISGRDTCQRLDDLSIASVTPSCAMSVVC